MFTFELWSNGGVLLADISHIAKNRQFSMRRNYPESLSFTINLDKFEELLSEIGATMQSVLEPYSTDVKVKFNNTYLFGTQVIDLAFALKTDRRDIRVTCSGYLDLLKDRYATVDYSSTDACAIARDLIATANADDDTGITNGNTFTIGKTRDREYERQNIKEAIINLTDLVDGRFDFWFNEDREFFTAAQVGTDKTNYIFKYPQNILSIDVPRTAVQLYNRITGIGSGIGDEALTSTVDDTTSQALYGVRERIITYNSVSLQQTLDDNVAADLDLAKSMLEQPSIVTNTQFFPLDEFGIGDEIHVQIAGHPSLSHIDAAYLVEKIDVDIDDNDYGTVTLTVDDYFV